MAGLGLATLVFSLLHHFLPEVFNVPENRGVPLSSYPEMLAKDLMTVFFAALCFLHSLRALGWFRTTLFFMGSFVFTGLQESVWILFGRFELVGASYYFPKGIFWFFETPVSACLGWYYLAYSTMLVAGYLLRSSSILGRAALAGALAVDFDLWIDPLATQPETMNWVWLSKEPLRIFSIPSTNFAGWFLLIFVFAILFERVPDLLKKHGAGKCALIFFGWLLLADVALLFTLMGLRRLISFLPATNLTIGGI